MLSLNIIVRRDANDFLQFRKIQQSLQQFIDSRARSLIKDDEKKRRDRNYETWVRDVMLAKKNNAIKISQKK